METNSTTLEAPAAGAPGSEAQPTAPVQKPEAGAKPVGKAQAEKPASINTPENAEKLRLILRREKEDPNVKFTDQDLNLYDAYMEGKLKPSKRGAAPKELEGKKPEAKPVISEPKADEAEDLETGEEADPEADPEEDLDPADDDDGAGQPNPDAEALMKEVGAKSLKDAVAKVKELRSKLGGKDAQAVTRLERQIQNEQALWQDVAKGVPAAIAHAERVYGLKLSGSAAATPAQNGYQAPAQAGGQGDPNGRAFISEDAFIDPESAKMVNEVLRKTYAELDELKNVSKSFNEERERTRRDGAMTQAKAAVVDEMVTVAQRMDPLKAIPNLREAIADWYDKGKPDPRLEVFNELFEIAQKEGCNLTAAATIKRGLEADRLVAEAEERGRKAAYGHKPNPSLSGSQGGRNEQGNYSPLSNEQIEAMSEDHRLMPGDWFDKDERPVKSKIPKKAWGLFGFTS
jgi:hypothetical protein